MYIRQQAPWLLSADKLIYFSSQTTVLPKTMYQRTLRGSHATQSVQNPSYKDSPLLAHQRLVSIYIFVGWTHHMDHNQDHGTQNYIYNLDNCQIWNPEVLA